LSYQTFVADVPRGVDLDHKCRVRCCINPDHLEPVTHSENLKRSPLMGRQAHKTHCPKGHPYSGTNNRGQRICHTCAAEITKRYREKRNELAS
jgi:HNH endonuclease